MIASVFEEAIKCVHEMDDPPGRPARCKKCGMYEGTIGLLDEIKRLRQGPLTFAQLRGVNVSRCAKWHGTGSEPWVLSDWSNAAAGELGEACNVVKKIRRVQTGAKHDPEGHRMADLKVKLKKEIADTAIYLDLLAHHAEVDLAEAIREKFNEKSIENGFPERL